jgi:Predicted phage phi-C31 gp36 major capsid-like protein
MNISQLKAEHRAKSREARELIKSIKDDTPEAEAKKIERKFDGLILEVEELRDAIEDAEDRAADEYADPRRPYERANSNGIDSCEPEFALKPDQRFTTWAKARPDNSDELSRLGAGQFLRSMIVGGKTDVERRALSEGSDSAGGYTVPTVLSSQLIDLARAASVSVRAGAQTVPLTSDNNNIAKLASDPVPAWRSEGGAVAESDPTFENVQMIPRSLAFYTNVSAEVMEDSLNLATELPRIFGAAMAAELDRVALTGTGTAPEPRGVANVSGIGTYALDGALANYNPLVRARTGILTANSGPVSAFIMHPRDEGDFLDLVDGNGNPLTMHPRLSEIPTLTTTSIPIDGGTGTNESTIFAGNFQHMLIGIRSDIRVEVLKGPAYAGNLQYSILTHMRADVAVTHPGAFFTVTGVQG